jgi:hypothetical protein
MTATTTDNTTPPENHTECLCDHQLFGSGGVFFQSTGWICCANCNGWQKIRKAIK